MNRTLFSYLIFLLPAFVSAQSSSYRLLDSNTREPISYTHIYSASGKISTITNEEGEFEIRDMDRLDTLFFSHVGYSQNKVLVTNQKVFYLPPNTTVLNEVIVLDEDVSSIVESIANQLERAEIKYGKAFYREISTRNRVPTEWIEAFYDISYSKNGVQEVFVNQARFARKKYSVDSPFLSHPNFPILTVATSLFSEADTSGGPKVGKPFSEDFTSKYDFSVSDKFEDDGETFVVIDYSPIDGINDPLFSYGKFVYNKTRGQLFQYQLFLDHALGADQISHNNTGKEISIKNPVHHLQMDFSKSTGDLKLILVKFSYDFVQDGEVLPSETKSTLFIYENSKKPHRKLKEPTLLSEHVSKFENARYKASFWKENPVIKLTPEENAVIEAFEEQNAFRTYFK